MQLFYTDCQIKNLKRQYYHKKYIARLRKLDDIIKIVEKICILKYIGYLCIVIRYIVCRYIGKRNKKTEL